MHSMEGDPVEVLQVCLPLINYTVEALKELTSTYVPRTCRLSTFSEYSRCLPIPIPASLHQHQETLGAGVN